jgi:hypothetical protein
VFAMGSGAEDFRSGNSPPDRVAKPCCKHDPTENESGTLARSVSGVVG